MTFWLRLCGFGTWKCKFIFPQEQKFKNRNRSHNLEILYYLLYLQFDHPFRSINKFSIIYIQPYQLSVLVVRYDESYLLAPSIFILLLLLANFQLLGLEESSAIKVHIFWEGHKILRNLHRRFDHYFYRGDFAKICGLLRIYELYYDS